MEDEKWRNTVRPKQAEPMSGESSQQPDHSRYMPH